MNYISDSELVAGCRDGDTTAFSLLMERHEKQVFNYFHRLTLDEELAMELSQELFVRVYRGIGKFKGNSRFATWIISIAHNLYCEWCRRQRRQVSLDAVPEELHPPEAGCGGRMVEEDVTRADSSAMVSRALQSLDEEERQVVVLRHYHHLSGRQIAMVLGCREGTVWSRLHYALLKLKGLLHAEGVTDESR